MEILEFHWVLIFDICEQTMNSDVTALYHLNIVSFFSSGGKKIVTDTTNRIELLFTAVL